MQRLIDYFQNGRLADDQNRSFGVEVETLFVDAGNRPISLATSQAIWRSLVEDFGWEATETRKGKLVELVKNDFHLIYELGRHNFEITTPAELVSDCGQLFRAYRMIETEIFLAASSCGARPLLKGWDGFRNNTLILPDRRDEIWVELDGLKPLSLLSHTACIHFNLDLCSVEEGWEFMAKLKEKYQQLGWPKRSNGWAWREYLKTSRANYESGRYGWPPAKSLGGYCRKLSTFRLVMNKRAGRLSVANPAMPFTQTLDPDINLFLRSVWWIFRLRVRGGRLVLEIRDVPRGIPLEEAWGIIKNTIGI